MRCFMPLCPSQKGLPRWSYVMIMVLFLPLELLLLVTFSSAFIWLTFDGYCIIWVYCGCFFSDAFCTPLIIVATSCFCLGLTSLVVTESLVLVVLIFLLLHSFNACSVAEYFSIYSWVSQLSRDHSSLPYYLVVFPMSTPFSIWFIFPLPLPPRPPQSPLPRPPLPSNWPPLPPLPPLPYELTCRLRPYLPGYGWVAGKRSDIIGDKYVEAVSKIALWLDLQILTSVFKKKWTIDVIHELPDLFFLI